MTSPQRSPKSSPKSSPKPLLSGATAAVRDAHTSTPTGVTPA
ncbi:hypothetical protein [Streptomyces sp. DSM 118878]